MRQRIAAFGGVGVAVLLGFVLLSVGIGSRPVSAMEQMAQSIRKAASYKYTAVVRQTDPGREPIVTEFAVYWLAPETARTEITRRKDDAQGPQVVEIDPGGKPRITIYPRTKAYRIYPPLKSGSYLRGVDRVQDLARCSGQADRQLGTREINGKLARGFQIDMAKISGIINEEHEPGPSAADGSRAKRMAEIWLDPHSNLPVLVRYTGYETYFGGSSEVEFRDIQWNIDVDPKLFDTTPPEGYKDVTPRLTVAEQVGQIREFLKIWVEVSGGQYPRASGNPMWQDFADLFQVSQWRTDPDVKKRYAAKCLAANKGFLVFDDIRTYNADFAYHGETVGPNDKDKLLLRWRLDDGRYEAIFGDLTAETVTADRLHALEGK